jgi:hypothetical protein
VFRSTPLVDRQNAQAMTDKLPRKPYTPPSLHVHGSVAQLTRQVRPKVVSEVTEHFQDLESSQAKLDSNV